MKIYIDFDGTLFNNGKHYKNIINILKKYNITEEYINNLTNNKHYKNMDNLVKEIIINNNLDKSILKEINTIYTEELIYKDIIPFLEKYQNQYDLILLTLGTKNYQLKKIKSSNISKYFKEIIITNKKMNK